MFIRLKRVNQKYLLLFFLILFTTSTYSQNFQLHYDFGEEREFFTSTIEMFKPDDFGATFFFIDFNYDAEGNKSISLAYFEIARFISIPGLKNISATIQYNDGTAPWGRLGNVWLAGGSYNFGVEKGSLSIQFLYRWDYRSKNRSNLQTTLVWYVPFLNNKLSFKGFMDIWTAEYSYMNDSKFVLLAEPQIWYNVWRHLHIGSEFEITSNFIPGKDGLHINPTIAFKWVF